jgi:hypothetical protein
MTVRMPPPRVGVSRTSTTVRVGSETLTLTLPGQICLRPKIALFPMGRTMKTVPHVSEIALPQRRQQIRPHVQTVAIALREAMLDQKIYAVT